MRALFIAFLYCASLYADDLIIPVVAGGWQITFQGPMLSVESMQPNPDGLEYKANVGRFNISAFVEAPSSGGGDNKACRDAIWSQASRNPMIQKETVKQWSTKECECVQYTIAGEFQGEKFTQMNINCFFEHDGKWVDIHASVISPDDADVTMLTSLAKSLAHGPLPKSEGAARQFLFPRLGRLNIDLPVGWLVGNQTIAKHENLPEQHTVSLFSVNDPNKNWKMTFFPNAARCDSLEDIMKLAKNAQQSAIAGSVEGRANLQEIKLKQGVGCLATYTDSSLVNKPVEIGNAKVIASGFVAPVPSVLGSVTIFADDVTDQDFKAAIQALGTIRLEQSNNR